MGSSAPSVVELLHILSNNHHLERFVLSGSRSAILHGATSQESSISLPQLSTIHLIHVGLDTAESLLQNIHAPALVEFRLEATDCGDKGLQTILEDPNDHFRSWLSSCLKTSTGVVIELTADLFDFSAFGDLSFILEGRPPTIEIQLYDVTTTPSCVQALLSVMSPDVTYHTEIIMADDAGGALLGDVVLLDQLLCIPGVEKLTLEGDNADFRPFLHKLIHPIPGEDGISQFVWPSLRGLSLSCGTVDPRELWDLIRLRAHAASSVASSPEQIETLTLDHTTPTLYEESDAGIRSLILPHNLIMVGVADEPVTSDEE